MGVENLNQGQKSHKHYVSLAKVDTGRLGYIRSMQASELLIKMLPVVQLVDFEKEKEFSLDCRVIVTAVCRAD